MTTVGQSFDWERWNDDKTFYESKHSSDGEIATIELHDVDAQQKLELEQPNARTRHSRAARMQLCCLLTFLVIVGGVGAALYAFA